MIQGIGLFVVAIMALSVFYLTYRSVEAVSRKRVAIKQAFYQELFTRAAGSEAKAEAVRQVLAGRSYADVGKEFGLSRSTLHRITLQTCEKVNPQAYAVFGGGVSGLRKHKNAFVGGDLSH
jgi:uncharacterized protein YerC